MASAVAVKGTVQARMRYSKIPNITPKDERAGQSLVTDLWVLEMGCLARSAMKAEGEKLR